MKPPFEIVDESYQRQKNESLFQAIKEKASPDKIRLLIQQGADPNAIDKDGYTPLLTALARRSPKAIRNILIEAGADIYYKHTSLGTPFELAAQLRIKLDTTKIPKRKLDRTILIHDLNQAKSVFLNAHTKLVSQQTSICFFGRFRKTKINANMTMQEIMQHALNGNNRTRQVMKSLGWVTQSGEISEYAPQCIRDLSKPNIPDHIISLMGMG